MTSDTETIRREKATIEARYGPWTAHNVTLADGLCTMSDYPTGDEVKLRRVIQALSDLLEDGFKGVRALDLACLEGMYALELAQRGAEVMAIEGREANLEKARFAARTLGLEVDFRLADVRDLDRGSHGEFDVVLCLGILYHLDAPDVFTFVERMAAVCTRVLVIDTHVALDAPETRTHDGWVYRGRTVAEHSPESSEGERLEALWSSLDNPKAFVPTRSSLLSLLARAGFTSVAEVHVPAEPEKTLDRITLVGLKGTAVTPLVTPPPATDPASVPERPPLVSRLSAGRLWSLGRIATPRPLRARVRRLLGAETRRH